MGKSSKLFLIVVSVFILVGLVYRISNSMYIFNYSGGGIWLFEYSPSPEENQAIVEVGKSNLSCYFNVDSRVTDKLLGVSSLKESDKIHCTTYNASEDLKSISIEDSEYSCEGLITFSREASDYKIKGDFYSLILVDINGSSYNINYSTNYVYSNGEYTYENNLIINNFTIAYSGDLKDVSLNKIEINEVDTSSIHEDNQLTELEVIDILNIIINDGFVLEKERNFKDLVEDTVIILNGEEVNHEQ